MQAASTNPDHFGPRWAAARKEEVVLAIKRGKAMHAYLLAHPDLTPAEIGGWLRHFDRRGRRGLRTTKLQERRHG